MKCTVLSLLFVLYSFAYVYQNKKAEVFFILLFLDVPIAYDFRLKCECKTGNSSASKNTFGENLNK